MLNHMRSKNHVFDVLIIGGGAAGILAAISAARVLGPNKVGIIESNERIGRKLLATGNGRCNFSNTNIKSNDYNNPHFVRAVFNKFTPNKTLKFFEELGLLAKIEDDRIYPFSGSATSLLEILKLELAYLEVPIINNTIVQEIIKHARGFLLNAADGSKLYTKHVIITTGGQASPKLGSNGSGYDLLVQFGHKLIKTEPGLTGFNCNQDRLKELGLKSLDGLRLQVKADCYVTNKKDQDLILKASEKGEVLFRSYGLSGIVIFQLSRFISSGRIVLDIFPDLSEAILYKNLLARRKLLGHLRQEAYFTGMLHHRIGLIIMRRAGIESLAASISALTDSEIKKLAKILKYWSFPVTSTTGWQQAQITLGGLDVEQFHEATLESKICSGIFAAGEVLNIDGPCGGYNLQWAWSSGWLAGLSAATK